MQYTPEEICDYLVAVQHNDAPSASDWGDSLNRMGTRKLTRYRAFLYFKQCMKCYYCSGHMQLRRFESKRGVQQPENLATFEHLDDAWSHGKRNESLDRVVLACRACNDARSSIRTAEAHNYYRSKFESIEAYKKFCHRATAADFIEKFGKMPAADEAYNGTRTHTVKKNTVKKISEKEAARRQLQAIVDSHQAKINQIMLETGMDYLQANNHVHQRQFSKR